MKIKRINTAILLLALAGMTLTGCSNEDLANVTPQEEGAGNVSFSIVEKDYEPADNTPKSRAAIEETKPEIQDLGDGLIAEVSLVPDTTHRVENPKTRAINTPTHYTIQAFQGGVKKGELKGTFNGSTFTPDTGQPKSIGLPHGTYDFVCFNDGVTSNGTQLTVNRADAATARFDVRRNVQINQDPKQQVKFTMKHAGAAVNVYTSYVNFELPTEVTSTQYVDRRQGLSYKLKLVFPTDQYKYTIGTPVNTIPETMVYNLTSDTYTYPTMGQLSKSGEVDAGGVPVAYSTPGAGPLTSFGVLLEDYWLPTTDCSKLRIAFTSGAPLGCSLAGKSITAPAHKQVEANKRYMMWIRFYLTNQYLYSDGTAGPRDKNPSKTPVGVAYFVRRESDGRIQGFAIALHDVNKGGSDQIQWNNTTAQESMNTFTSYSDLFSSGQAIGPGPAIQAARDYTPKAGSLQWDLPSFPSFMDLGKDLGKMLNDFEMYEQYLRKRFNIWIPSGATGFNPAPSTINFPAMDMTYFNNAFTKEGGTPPSGTYWTSSECKDGTEYKQATVTISGGKYHLGLKSKTETAKIRPFIQF
ncbi:hypothetical protein [Prevotella sp.]